MNNQEDVVKNGNADMNLFFHDEEFEGKYPGVKAPPPCFIDSGAKIIAYEPNKSLTVAFPIREDQTNPVGSPFFVKALAFMDEFVDNSIRSICAGNYEQTTEY